MQETYYGYSRFQEAAYKRELQHGTRDQRFTFSTGQCPKNGSQPEEI